MNRHLPSQPRIAVIGGGTGLSTMLRGLKRYSSRITAIVTVADDGGGSGVLREELGMLPPGDIRNCICALANTEPTMDQLMSYRFTEGRLAGQSLGNLMLAALNDVTGSFVEAVNRMSDVLAITGRVLPVSSENVQLEAVFDDGSTVVGQSKIAVVKRGTGRRIDRVRLIPEYPDAIPEALAAIREADLVVIGPGSLYTSIAPNLITKDVAKAVVESPALKVYVLNVMTQPGETDGYAASDHIQALFDLSGEHLFGTCLANNMPIPAALAEKYAAEGSEPVRLDEENVAKQGVELLHAPVAKIKGDLVRHDPEALDAIREADLVVIGPGSLYTSIAPNLITKDVAKAVVESPALKVYVLNVMTQPGETDGYAASDHIQALFDLSGEHLFGTCLANNMPIPAALAEKYAAEGSEPVRLDEENVAKQGVELLHAPVAKIKGDLVRHDPEALARELIWIYRARAETQVYG